MVTVIPNTPNFKPLPALDNTRGGPRRQPKGKPSQTVANALKYGINEHYDSVTGKTLGVDNLGMSCAIVTLMLDQLTSKYHLKVKGAT
ncbi:MAG: hypothetical protein NT154_42080 [Verrucomicrobia bacterium]|nr:hypothetical protein [Verrucomicrobiota bacterium]